MNLITNNPYRTLGLLAGANVREVNRQASRLKKIIATEQEPPTDDFSFPALGNLTRSTESIEEAISKLNLDSDKMNAALFWFWNGNPITDEVAFDALKEGNVEEAFQIWDKLIVNTKEDGGRFWRPVTDKNASAFHNHFVLEILRANGNKVSAITANLYFLESEFSQKFISTIADSTHRTNAKELQTNFLTDILQETEQGKINLTLSKFVSILNSISFIAKDDFLKNISRKYVNNVSAQIETAKKKRIANNANAAKAGEELYAQTKNDLEQLKSIFGVQDFAYSSISDKVANEILQCSIDFFNHSQDINANNDYHNVAIKLAKLAEGIAVGRLAKERVKDNINTLEEMKDREILQAIALLKSVKDAYETNEAKINREVMNMPLGYGQTINWSKVEEMKINAIDWNKVNEFLEDVLSDTKIEKIKTCSNDTQTKEFIELAEWIKAHSTSTYVIKKALNTFYGKKTKSKEITKIRNEYAWYNNPKSWNDFGSWWSFDWTEKAVNETRIANVGCLTIPLFLPINLFIGIIYISYRLIAWIIKKVKS